MDILKVPPKIELPKSVLGASASQLYPKVPDGQKVDLESAHEESDFLFKASGIKDPELIALLKMPRGPERQKLVKQRIHQLGVERYRHQTSVGGLRKEAKRLNQLIEWYEGKHVFERPAESRYGVLLSAIKAGKMITITDLKVDKDWLAQFDKSVQPFVIQHSWAQAFRASMYGKTAFSASTSSARSAANSRSIVCAIS